MKKSWWSFSDIFLPSLIIQKWNISLTAAIVKLPNTVFHNILFIGLTATKLWKQIIIFRVKSLVNAKVELLMSFPLRRLQEFSDWEESYRFRSNNCVDLLHLVSKIYCGCPSFLQNIWGKKNSIFYGLYFYLDIKNKYMQKLNPAHANRIKL